MAPKPALRSVHLQPMDPKPTLKGDDAPWPGSVYVINEGNTTNVITYDDETTILKEYEPGNPRQQWVCHARDGWLGLTNDPGESTVFLGYGMQHQPAILCRALHMQRNEMLCVRKRPGEGFQILMRYDDGLRPMGVNYFMNGCIEMIRNSETWWNFTKV
ncbi:hypothetical protein Dda_0784 [Drechslerella dactyloides]|uniref:Ricin B lectin domain-containing protein n=1 Tax=Drechslerella dactyloides TaxID=74499 RepID=A0AAD6J5I4_DREDA|nr:hypothetical protein Dda_0784 [Drechslerella dactyloides]